MRLHLGQANLTMGWLRSGIGWTSLITILSEYNCLTSKKVPSLRLWTNRLTVG